MLTALITIALGASSGATLDQRTTIALRGATIRIGDVTRGVTGPAAAVEIARLPAGRSSIALPRSAIAALVRRALPAIMLADGEPALVTLSGRRPPAPATPCFIARDAIGAGEVITAAGTRSERCGRVAPTVRYDAGNGTIVATRLIAAGDVVGRTLTPSVPAVGRGAALTLVARSGPVTVERPVVALQPGRRGGRVFVRAGDGQVFAVPVGEHRP